MPGFRDELVAAARRQHVRRLRRHRSLRRAATGGAAALVVAALIAVGSVVTSDPASASVTVNRVDGMWDVAVADGDATAAMVEAALEDQGLDATVAAVPVGPSRVGQFVSGDAAVTPADGSLSSPSVRFPVEQTTVHLLFGRPARPGEAYMAVSDAFAAGEPLECVTGVWGERVDVALPAVEQVFDDVTTVGGDDGVVGDVLAVGPDRAIVMVHTGDAPPGTVTGTDECPVG